MRHSNVLGLDVGTVRVGVAVAAGGVFVARPLKTLEHQAADFWEQFDALCDMHDITHVVIGLPRGLDGQETDQTAITRAFGEELALHNPELHIAWQDEALTSVKAEEALGQTKKPYTKSDIDALAASYILSDYITEREHTS